MRTLAFMIVRRLLGLVGLGTSPDAKDVEIAVLRHQLVVLRRQVTGLRYTPTDRMVLAALAKMLPRARWPVFLVTPSTLLRWHRELARRRWTYPTHSRRRGLEPQVIDAVQSDPLLPICSPPASTGLDGRTPRSVGRPIDEGLDDGFRICRGRGAGWH